jgi:signal transduction histidine kinase
MTRSLTRRNSPVAGQTMLEGEDPIMNTLSHCAFQPHPPVISIPVSLPAREVAYMSVARPSPAMAAQSTARLMAPVVHEMRNFLTPMRLSLEVLRRRVAGDEAAERAAQILQSQTEGLSRMVGDLLDTSRIATGKLALRPQHCVLQAIARRAVEMCEPSALDQSQQLVLECAEAPVSINADPLRLCQALANLVFNAVHHAPEGGRIRIEARAEGPLAILRVVDEGAGMSAETAARVFDLYAQANQGEDGGLGIGLYLVKSIAELHGGRAYAESAGQGKGSTFTIALPLGPRDGPN